MFETSRRRVLQAAGVGGAAAVAGCANAPTGEERTEQREQMERSKTLTVDRVAADPANIPAPIERDEPAEVDVELVPREVTAEVEDGVTFDYMTYNGQVPGPFIRVRRGDTVNVTFRNPAGNSMPHNVDFHAVAGPGGVRKLLSDFRADQNA